MCTRLGISALRRQHAWAGRLWHPRVRAQCRGPRCEHIKCIAMFSSLILSLGASSPLMHGSVSTPPYCASRRYVGRRDVAVRRRQMPGVDGDIATQQSDALVRPAATRCVPPEWRHKAGYVMTHSCAHAGSGDPGAQLQARSQIWGACRLKHTQLALVVDSRQALG